MEPRSALIKSNKNFETMVKEMILELFLRSILNNLCIMSLH
jgi:hypothetical protein